jgi:CRISPR system Cascade subunit CasA
MPSFSFNLVDEPWIPCLVRPPAPSGQHSAGTVAHHLLSLRETLARAHELLAIAGDAPPVTAALYRLLLAVVHRSCGRLGRSGPEDVERWAELWQRGRFDPERIDAYLAAWRHRFDLFDDRQPFYQTAAREVSEDKGTSIAKLLYQSDNNATLFDHSVVANPPPVSPAQAARLLVAYHAFDTGGLVTGAGAEKSADAGPLIQCAVLLVRGRNLFETLLLNLYRYSPEDGEPWEFDRTRDRPAWERDEDVRPEDRRPDGYLDLLTWQSRRIRLWPEEDAEGRVVVRRATVMKGWQFPDDWTRAGRETMVGFRKRLRARKDQDPFPPVGFETERALWRDSVALFESPVAGDGTDAARPKMFSWLATLAAEAEDVLPRTQRLPVDALGLAADRAKLLFWRHERLVLPLPYLGDDELGRRLRSALREALRLAEQGGKLMDNALVEVRTSDGAKSTKSPSPLRVLAQELLGANGDTDAVVEHLNPGRVYWAALEEPFRDLLDRLLDEMGAPRSNGDSATEGDSVALAKWRQAIRTAALEAFQTATTGLDRTARTMRAVALAERALRSQLYALVGMPGGASAATGAAVGG